MLFELLPKIRPIREDLDAPACSQKIIQISGQSRITVLKKYPNSIKFSTLVKKAIDKPKQTT
jgi:hypothetical protein